MYNSREVKDIERHAETTKHKKAKQSFHEQTQLSFNTLSNDVKATEAGISLFVAGYCSLIVVDHLSELCKVHFGDSKGCKNLKLRRSKCSSVISNVLAPYFHTKKDLNLILETAYSAY